MADDPSPFTQAIELGNLQIKALATMGVLSKDLAEARLTDARTADQRERTKTTEIINRALNDELHSLQRAEWETRQRIKEAKNNAARASLLISGQKPSDASLGWQIFGCFDWFCRHAGILTIYMLPVTAEHQAAKNFCPLGSRLVSDAPEYVLTFGALKSWLLDSYLWFRAGSAVHGLVLSAVGLLGNAQAKVIAELTAELAATNDAADKRLARLRTFLPTGA